MFSFFRNRRRRRLLAQPFPAWWESILVRNVAHYARLPAELQAVLRDITRILVAEKHWEGVGGQHAGEEVRVTVAAQAAIPLLRMPHDYYSRVPSIVVYPTSFRTPVAEDDWEDDELSDTILSGQAVYRGPVILAWDDVLDEGRDPGLSHNVVIHEFAHQLDFMDGITDGTPPLEDPKLRAKWQPVMQAAFDTHQAELSAGRETLFTEHAGESETEFFADAVELFFCRPHILHDETPGVYELFAAYFRVDPRAWFPDDA
jgi:MtfA peptidase